MHNAPRAHKRGGERARENHLVFLSVSAVHDTGTAVHDRTHVVHDTGTAVHDTVDGGVCRGRASRVSWARVRQRVTVRHSGARAAYSQGTLHGGSCSDALPVEAR
jgi:hypothetical protein